MTQRLLKPGSYSFYHRGFSSPFYMQTVYWLYLLFFLHLSENSFNINWTFANLSVSPDSFFGEDSSATTRVLAFFANEKRAPMFSIAQSWHKMVWTKKIPRNMQQMIFIFELTWVFCILIFIVYLIPLKQAWFDKTFNK